MARILDYVEERFDAPTALRVLERIESTFPLLQRNPGLGHRREDLSQDSNVLFWPVGLTLVAYRVREERLEVLAIERGSRDWTSFFD